MNHSPASESSRRHFLRAALAGSTALPALGWTAASVADSPAPSADTFHEPARDVPLVRDADVIVCGAGPAGVSAAIAAARAGARVRLFEANGCLGGVWTSGLDLRFQQARLYR
ncbi:FAD-dependent oxidoreductase [Gimesia panareensis]|uniref:FAD-dependent oxidoreductase n=1 Tax=Gimesia panareensis TaxID=2527978 RepID=UPI0018D7228E|nr:FAD-dependent oxidoreductase [Gimesia panareensis]